MRIRISDLPPEGLTISDTIPVEALNSRLNEGQTSDIRFTKSPQVDVFVRPTTDGAETKGKAHTKYLQSCGRCAEAIERELEIELNFILKAKPGKENAPEYVDDLGIIFFEGEHIEFESTVQESLILALSLFWSPPVDKQGKCSLCGKQPESEYTEKKGVTNLGELLKKAGVN